MGKWAVAVVVLLVHSPEFPTVPILYSDVSQVEFVVLLTVIVGMLNSNFFNIRSSFETIRIPFEVRIWALYCNCIAWV